MQELTALLTTGLPSKQNFRSLKPVKRVKITLIIPGTRLHSQFKLKSLVISQSFCYQKLQHTQGVTGVCE